MKENIAKLLQLAKQHDEKAIKRLVEMFIPLIRKKSWINGKFNEDCFQELNLQLIKSIYKFRLTDNLENITLNELITNNDKDRSNLNEA